MFGAFGGRFRSSAIAQEKSGEMWVNARMFGSPVGGDFEHCEVAIFIGKNPWMSHGFPRARTTLKSISNDPARALIVIDPRRTETVESPHCRATVHLPLRPGTNVAVLTSLAHVIVTEGLTDEAFIAERCDPAETAAWKAFVSRPENSPATLASTPNLFSTSTEMVCLILTSMQTM